MNLTLAPIPEQVDLTNIVADCTNWCLKQQCSYNIANISLIWFATAIMLVYMVLEAGKQHFPSEMTIFGKVISMERIKATLFEIAFFLMIIFIVFQYIGVKMAVLNAVA